MNKFSEISKKLGYAERNVRKLTRSEALKLWREVAEDESIEAFEKVFEYYRFALPGITEEEYEVSRIMVDAFREGQRIFSEQQILLNN